MRKRKPKQNKDKAGEAGVGAPGRFSRVRHALRLMVYFGRKEEGKIVSTLMIGMVVERNEGEGR